MRKLSKNLINKSTTAFFLSLELFNKPTIEYRIESFSVLFTNAWELILKAYLYEINKGKKLSIFRKKRRNQRRESIPIDECLNKVFPNNNDPIKRNIEFISGIRNEASHLIIQELDPYFSRIFQKGVEYYVDFLYERFAIDVNQKLKPGLISLITDVNRLPDISILKSRFNREDYTSILNLINKFDELDKLGATIPITYSIAIVKNQKKGNFIISSGKRGVNKALIIEKRRDPDITYPFNRKLAIIEIKKRISRTQRFNEYDFEAYTFVRGLKKRNNEYFYKGKYSGAGQYSQKFIEEIIQSINGNPRFLSQNRSQYKQHLKRKRN